MELIINCCVRKHLLKRNGKVSHQTASQRCHLVANGAICFLAMWKVYRVVSATIEQIARPLVLSLPSSFISLSDEWSRWNGFCSTNYKRFPEENSWPILNNSPSFSYVEGGKIICIQHAILFFNMPMSWIELTGLELGKISPGFIGDGADWFEQETMDMMLK